MPQSSLFPRLALAGALVAGTALPASASSLLAADLSRNTFGLGVGDGVSLSLDFPLSSRFSLGGSLNAGGFFINRSTTWIGNFDLRGQYQLIERSPLTLSIIAGVAAYAPGFVNPGFAPFVGVGLAYPFTRQLTGRLNLLAGFGPGGFYANSPYGFELAYKFTPAIEGTLGYNGRGDVLGLKIGF